MRERGRPALGGAGLAVMSFALVMGCGGATGGATPPTSQAPVAATAAPAVEPSAKPPTASAPAPASPPEKSVLEKAMAAITTLAPPAPAREPKLPNKIVAPPPEDVRGAEGRCTQGEMAGCREAGRLYFEGWGVSRDREKARTFAAKACVGGDVEACVLQSRVASATAAPDDPTSAADPARRACALASAEGCARLVRLWAEAAARGRPWSEKIVEAWIGDAKAARAATERLCDADVREACSARGFMGLEDAEGFNATLLWLAERCGRGVMDACGVHWDTKIGVIARAKGWKEPSFDAGEKALHARWVASKLDQCHRLRRECRRVASDKKGREALKYLWAGCVEGRDFGTCTSLAQDLREAQPSGRDEALSIAFRAETCLHAEDSGDIVECSDAAYRYGRGDKVAKDEARAFALNARKYTFRRAECERWAPGAESYGDCRAAALQLESGDGVARDLAAALALYSRGCTEAKDSESCEARARVKKKIAAEPQAGPPSK